jgi:Uma2 family endonuclease
MRKTLVVLAATIVTLGLLLYAASPRALSVDDLRQMGLVEDDPRFIEIALQIIATTQPADFDHLGRARFVVAGRDRASLRRRRSQRQIGRAAELRPRSAGGKAGGSGEIGARVLAGDSSFRAIKLSYCNFQVEFVTSPESNFAKEGKMPYLAKKPRPKQSLESANAAGLVTFDKFYEIVEENVKADLLDGKIIRDSPAMPRHGETCMWFSTVLTLYVQKFDLGKINGGTTTVRLSKYQGPEPDIFFVRKSRLRIIVDEKYVDGPPDLCIEVISKSSRKIDRGRKYTLYAEHGVKEYWIIDPLRLTLEFYENQNGAWAEIKPDEQGRLHSKVLPGFWLKPRWFRVFPLPPVFKTVDAMISENQQSR